MKTIGLKNTKSLFIIILIILGIIQVFNLNFSVDYENDSNSLQLRELKPNNQKNSEKNSQIRSSMKSISQYQNMANISILNNTAFGPSGYNFPGTGTQSDPFIIKGYNVTNTGVLIEIINTDVYFNLSNNLLNGLWNGSDIPEEDQYYGLNLENVTHGIIENNVIFNVSRESIRIQTSTDNTVRNNTVYNGYNAGVKLIDKTNNTLVYNNTFYNNIFGVYLEQGSSNNIIKENNIYQNGVGGIIIDNPESIGNAVIGNTLDNNDGHPLFFDWGYAIIVLGNSTVIQNNTISNHANYGLVFSDGSSFGVPLINPRDNIVRYNIFNDNGPVGHSQAADNGTNNLFEYNYWNEWTSPDSEVDGIVDIPYVINGTANSLDSFSLTTKVYIVVSPTILSPTISILNNTAFGPSGYDFPGTGTENDPYIIEGYNITDTGVLIEIVNTDVYFNLSNNLLNGLWNGIDDLDSYEYYGINLENVKHGIIENNIIYNASREGIRVMDSTNITVTNNTIYNGPNAGVKLQGSTNNTLVYNNTIFDNFLGIILEQGPSTNTIKDNLIYGNKGSGIVFFDPLSKDNIIIGNTIYNNSDPLNPLFAFGFEWGFGILVVGNNTVIQNNTISNHTNYGVLISDIMGGIQWNNIIQYNVFTDNGPVGKSQVADNGTNNLFKFNYYNDWTGPDVIPTGGDGIVDNPYAIDGTANNNDPFPLTNTIYNIVPVPPVIVTAPNPLNFLEGTTGHNLIWNATNTAPLTYDITQDGIIIVDSAVWSSGIPVILDLDPLALTPDEYNFTITFFNSFNQQTTHWVIVTVTSSPTILSPTISILNNSAFGPSGYDFPGTGTENDPYIIDGFNITFNGVLIEIIDTDVYFILSNNLLNGLWNGSELPEEDQYYGLNLENVTHGIIENNVIFNVSRESIRVQTSTDITVRNNNIYNGNNAGVKLINNAHYNTVTSNTIYNNIFGLYLEQGSSYNIIRDNSIYQNGVGGIIIDNPLSTDN
ncbi:MAG: right-handed parallel beta-helix repeat-containing protein, partial [Candidatus Hodarchaeales archaeon]